MSSTGAWLPRLPLRTSAAADRRVGSGRDRLASLSDKMEVVVKFVETIENEARQPKVRFPEPAS